MSSSPTSSKNQKRLLPWHIVEKQIQQEVNWLRGAIATVSNKEKPYFPVTCRECLMRKIAILIVTGQVKARQINKKAPLKSFWKPTKRIKNVNRPIRQRHGSDWHKETMERIENHFLSRSYQIEREPNVTWGRADLGVYKKGKPDLLIEVGTTSFFKLWISLEAGHNFIYLIVPDDNTLIEFVRL